MAEDAGQGMPVCVASTKLLRGRETLPEEPLRFSPVSLSTPAQLQSKQTSDDTSIDEHTDLTWFKGAEW
jgi:hypothetical protein